MARKNLRRDAAVCACNRERPCFYHVANGGWEEIMEIKRATSHLINYGYQR